LKIAIFALCIMIVDP